MSDVQPAPSTSETVIIRLHMFDAPHVELAHSLHSDDEESVTVSAALKHMQERMNHRLGVLTFVVGALEELGWEVRLDGEALTATAHMSPAQAREVLEAAGVAGPMTAVTDIGDDGWPLLLRGEKS